MRIGRGSRGWTAGAVLSLALLCGQSVQAIVDVVSPNRFTVNVGGFDLEVPIELSQPIDTPDPAIVHMIVVIHGSSRDSDQHFARVQDAAVAVARDQDTLIVSPQFLNESDVEFWALPATTLYWSGGWRHGNKSQDTTDNPRPERISSYGVVDAIFDAVIDPVLFPNLQSVAITGHSGGGQFVQRFAASSQAEDTHSGVSFRYLVGNPSSYLYLTPERVLPGAPRAFGLPSASELSACPEYNEYRYGLEDPNDYIETAVPAALLERYRGREVHYLLGLLDTSTGQNLDDGCEASLQGGFRLERGLIFHDYLQHTFDPWIHGKHFVRVVPGVGHSSEELYASTIARDALFGAPPAVPALPILGHLVLGALFVGGGVRRCLRLSRTATPAGRRS